MIYTIKGFKEFNGMEDRGYNVNLLCDGSKVAEAIYGGDGGEVQVRFDDKSDEKVFMDYLKTLPLVTSEYCPEGLAVSPDIYLDGLINVFNEEKQLRRWCKKKVVCIVKGGKPGSYITFAVLYTKEYADKLRAIRSDIIEIVNERFL